MVKPLSKRQIQASLMRFRRYTHFSLSICVCNALAGEWTKTQFECVKKIDISLWRNLPNRILCFMPCNKARRKKQNTSTHSQTLQSLFSKSPTNDFHWIGEWFEINVQISRRAISYVWIRDTLPPKTLIPSLCLMHHHFYMQNHYYNTLWDTQMPFAVFRPLAVAGVFLESADKTMDIWWEWENVKCECTRFTNGKDAIKRKEQQKRAWELFV